MKKILITSLMVLSIFAFSNCEKKDNTQKDTLTQVLLAGGGSGSNGSSCVLGTKCQETEGLIPIQFNFADYCASQKGTLVAKTCTDGGFTKDCTTISQSLGAVKTCTKAQ